jgi:hypothetical protein
MKKYFYFWWWELSPLVTWVSETIYLNEDERKLKLLNSVKTQLRWIAGLIIQRRKYVDTSYAFSDVVLNDTRFLKFTKPEQELFLEI